MTLGAPASRKEQLTHKRNSGRRSGGSALQEGGVGTLVMLFSSCFVPRGVLSAPVN